MVDIKLYLKSMYYRFARFDKRLNQQNIVSIYRYVSWFLTSIFYLMDKPKATLGFRFVVIVSLFAAGEIILNIYLRNSNNPKLLGHVVIIETLGIILLIIPTGGIKSPFLWYALSPVLISAIYLKSYICWVNLFVYIAAASIASCTIFEKNTRLLDLLINNGSYFIVFFLITFSVQMYSGILKRLGHQAAILRVQRQELIEANRKIEKTVEQIKSLYHIVETFTTQDSIESFMNTFVDYVARITGSNLSFLWLWDDSNSKGSIAVSSCNVDKNDMLEQLNGFKCEINCSARPVVLSLLGKNFLISELRLSSAYSGIIGIESSSQWSPSMPYEYEGEISFLSELCIVVLERFNLEKAVNRLIILEEQNRIANEIHDNISQRLFSISCAIHTMESKIDTLHRTELKKQLILCRESLNTAMRELRTCIYGLSSKKNEDSRYFDILKKYLDDFANLNGIKVDICIGQGAEIHSDKLKRAFFRIIQEACGNALRHGKCQKIKISFDTDENFIKLSILDDGQGFSLQNLKARKDKGLGINNMQRLIKELGGKFTIISNENSGTEIKAVVANEYLHKCEKEVV